MSENTDQPNESGSAALRSSCLPCWMFRASRKGASPNADLKFAHDAETTIRLGDAAFP